VTDLSRRVKDAALATERLARTLASEPNPADPVIVAYLRRLQHAAARVDEFTEVTRREVEAESAYLGILQHRGETTSERNP